MTMKATIDRGDGPRAASVLDTALAKEIEGLAEKHLLREPPSDEGALSSNIESRNEPVLNLCSNDYLGYAKRPLPAGITAGGAGASRLVHGSHAAHVAAERALADWLGVESTLLFSSGFAANLGTIAALARRGDVLVSDALNHASIIDGCRLSGAEVRVVPHLDTDAVESALRGAQNAARRWVVTESYFSMDGDTPDLPRLRAICDAHGAALIVDEAHALGVFGPRGTGLCAAHGILPDVRIGTLGKAFGLQGAFVAGSRLLRTYLWNRARSFVFSTGLSPALTQAVATRVTEIAEDDAGRRRLSRVATELRNALSMAVHDVAKEDLRVPSATGPILPVVVGDALRALGLSKQLQDKGILVQAIRPPTVPDGTARLRITARADLCEAELSRATATLIAVLRGGDRT